ncbi:hypothetical protein G6Z94_11725 [Vibrio aestuarianus]|uniref:hypothetical protein n=1 Tax=Vibrio aestuarianus TaxID=28171 RepID=UPI001593943B|nr:hypothetical protein [Vibrio aestuarianus]NGZ18008.1 hypothetical protein [Vibrio aestuarianus]
MMAFTVRPSEEETKVIQKAAEKLGVKSMSKAVILACGEMLDLQKQLKAMERKHYQSERRAAKAESAIAAYQKSQSALMGFSPDKDL